MSSAEHVLDQADDVTLQRWTRYGHDRMYVHLEGVDIGYCDLKTGEVVCARAEHRDLIERVTGPHVDRTMRRGYVPRHAARDVADVEVERSDVTPVRHDVELLPDQDLADNVPGQAVREWARQARDEAPVRTFIARVAGIKTSERNRRIGGDGEMQVGRKLSKLGKDWRVLHSVPVGSRGSDIDHIVIGPGGVFTVNTKHHPDANVWVHGNTVKVNGSSHRYVRDSRFEAERAGQLLSTRTLFEVGVRGVVAVVGAQSLTIKAQPHDGLVTVVTAKELVAHLRDMPTRLDASSAERIYLVARHLATWQPDTVMWSDFA